MFNNPYINPQVNIDRINSQIKELELARQQYQQPQPPIQNIINTNQNQGIRYAETIEDVKKEFVIQDSLFLNKEQTLMWLKKTTGETKTYEIREIVEKDEKDAEIDELRAKINELEKRLNNEPTNDDTNATKSNKNKKPQSSEHDTKRYE